MRRALVVLLLLAAPAQAADPAAFDRGYGKKGAAEIPFARHVAPWPGGGLVGAGNARDTDGFGVAVLDARGRLAKRATLALGAGSRAEAVAVAPGRRVLVAGTVTTGEPPRPVLAVARLTPALALDPSFGDAGVTVLPDVTPRRDDGRVAVDMKVLPGGRVAVLTDRFTIVALTADGRPDPARSSDPLTRLGAPDPEAEGSKLLALRDGRLLALGQSAWEYGERHQDSTPLLVRLDAQGVPDPNFGQRGIAYGSFTLATGLTVQRSGRIVLSGYSCSFAWDPLGEACPYDLLGLTRDGRRDPRFGTKGELGVWRTDGEALDVTALPDDRLLLATDDGTARLLPDGDTDLRYGRCGVSRRHGGATWAFPLPRGAALLAVGAESGPGEARRIMGGGGSFPRDARPPFAPRFRGSLDFPVGTLKRKTFRLPAYIPVDARVRVRVVIVGLGDGFEHVPLTARMLRRLRLPRTVATGAGRVRPCRDAGGVTIRWGEIARRRLRASRRGPFVLGVRVTAITPGGSRTRRQNLTLQRDGGLFVDE